MRTLTYIGIIGFIIIVAVYLYSAQKIGSKRERQFYILFDTTDVKGKLEYAKIGYHGVIFKVEGIKNEFVFYPYTGYLNKNEIFYNIAKKGDMIIKPKNSDTLRLVKENRVYLYTFQRF